MNKFDNVTKSLIEKSVPSYTIYNLVTTITILVLRKLGLPTMHKYTHLLLTSSLLMKLNIEF